MEMHDPMLGPEVAQLWGRNVCLADHLLGLAPIGAPHEWSGPELSEEGHRLTLPRESIWLQIIHVWAV